jgi:hypothetical protein
MAVCADVCGDSRGVDVGAACAAWATVVFIRTCDSVRGVSVGRVLSAQRLDHGQHMIILISAELCCLGVLARRWAITGTLDPVRGLTGLTELSLSTNALIGRFMQTPGRRDDCECIGRTCVCVCVCVCACVCVCV